LALLKTLTLSALLLWAALGLSAKLFRACAPAPPTPAADAPVLLVGGAVFAGGERVAQRLQHMLNVTGVLGDSPVRVIHAESARPASLLRALEGAGPARAALVVLGDLSLLDGIDPNARIPPQKQLSSRVINWDAFDVGLTLLKSWADRNGTALVLCTPPLGIQGRVEVPELLEIVRHLAGRGRVLDLNGRFAELEPGPLFANGIDQLDEAGHDALADMLYRALLSPTSPLPPRTPTEKRARRLMAALHAWAEGDDDALKAAADAGLERPGSNRSLSTLAAALASARLGITPQTARLWGRVDPQGEILPALAVGRGLSQVGSAETRGFERELVAALGTLVSDGERARRRAETLTRAHPERLEAWMALLAAELAAGGTRPSLPSAKARLLVFDRRPVAPGRARELLAAGTLSLHTLPALLAVSAPYEGALVTGPALRSAQRKARVGFRQAALKLLDKLLAAGPCPESWRRVRAAIASQS